MSKKTKHPVITVARPETPRTRAEVDAMLCVPPTSTETDAWDSLRYGSAGRASFDQGSLAQVSTVVVAPAPDATSQPRSELANLAHQAPRRRHIAELDDGTKIERITVMGRLVSERIISKDEKGS